MQPPSQIDVLVIGGGPAGLATAIELASRDYGVLVIDRSTPPIDKPCGEGLMPDGVLRLEELGVELSADQRAPFRGLRYIEGELRAEARFQEGSGFGVRRLVLHAALCDRAREVGVAFQWQTVVRGLTDEGVETDRGEIEARWTIGADAGYRDAITGEGMSLALHQASALADAISVGDLAQYQRAVRRMTALPFRLIGLLLIAERRPWLRHRLLTTLAHEPAIFARLLAIHARQRPVRELGAGGVLRLARGLLSG